MRFVSIAALAAAFSAGTALASEPILTPETIASAEFADWQARVAEAPVALEVDSRTGELQAAGPEEAAAAVADDAVELVEVPGQPDAVIAAPEETTDLPDMAAAEAAVEPAVLEEASATAQERQEAPDPFLVRLQILLDRAQASPGVIDGFLGDNTRKAVAAFEEMRGLEVDGEPDEEMWAALKEDDADPTHAYEITSDDLERDFVGELPSDYAELAELEWLGYADAADMFAERFHTDARLIALLNPDADLSAPGTQIVVPDVASAPEAEVKRIVVNREAGTLQAFDGKGTLVLAAPATVGSEDNPSPSGTLTVDVIAPEPTYTYDPERNFQQGENTSAMILPAGPRGPVGSMWIGLDKPTFGIHGTARPAMIDRQPSHGCVRLTNWDAEKLAELVVPEETVVEFED